MNDIKHYLQSRVDNLTRLSGRGSSDLRRQGYAYSSVAAWFSEHGEAMKSGAGTWTSAEAAIIKELSERVRLRHGHCFANAQRVVLAAIGLSDINLDEDLAYGEGYAWVAGQRAPFAHGWCLLDDKVWDPSLDSTGWVTYFGTTFPPALLVARTLRRGMFGPLVNDWRQQWPLLKQPWRGPETLRAAEASAPA